MAKSSDRLDDAARAGWLYYIAGKTQDQVAAALGVSRQAAQRLVAMAMSEGLVKVRIDHPIAHCLDLARQMRARFGLRFCEITPSDPTSTSSVLGISQAAAAEIERWLSRPEPALIAIGTGRTLKAAVEQLPRIDCPQHRIVSLTGNIFPDGAAAYYNVIFTLANLVTARSFPMPMPVVASSPEERETLHAQPMMRRTLDLAARADVAFVGVGEFDLDAPLRKDGFLGAAEVSAMAAAGAVGEILGWIFDQNGALIPGMANDRVASANIPPRDSSLVIGAGMGARKLPAIQAALRGRLINGLITDERTAEALLAL